MGIEIDTATPEGWHAALAALAWQFDAGVAEVIGDIPVNAYDLPDRAPWLPAPQAQAQSRGQAGPNRGPAPAPRAAAEPYVPSLSPAERERQQADAAVAEATAAAARAGDLDALREAIAAYDHCELKRGARNLVFADGRRGARVLVLGEAPGREEDMAGKPFVGAAGQLLDRMFAAIGLSRDGVDAERAFYVTNVLTWRPPGNRDPEPDEIAVSLPFLRRHVDLVAPDLIVLMGNIACQAAIEKRGILRLRGQWVQAFGRPALPMTHPSYLLRNPTAKREAWADLLSLQARLESLSV